MSGAVRRHALHAAVLALAAVALLDPDGAHRRQVDRDGGEVELECDDDDGLAHGVGCVDVGEQLEERVEANCAHDYGCTSESEDGNYGDLLPSWHLELGKDGDG